MLSAQINAGEQSLQVVVRPTTKIGAPAKLEPGTLALLSDNPDVLADGVVTEETEGEGEAAVTIYRGVCRSGVPGRATLTVQADADLGEGVKLLAETIDVIVTTPQAQNLGLSVSGIPQEPEPAPVE